MAQKVRGQVLGGQEKTFNNVETVGDLAAKLGASTGYAATVNGEPADFDQELNDYEFVSFTAAVKGGR